MDGTSNYFSLLKTVSFYVVNIDRPVFHFHIQSVFSNCLKISHVIKV